MEKKPKGANAKQDLKAEDETLEKAMFATSTELHLQQFPVFHLTPSKLTDNCITFNETIREGGAVLNRCWSVHIQPSFGWPGEHEAEVWRAIEHIVHIRRTEGRLKNPIDTSFSEIRKYMSGKGRGGIAQKRIKQAIYCLSSTKVSTSFFYHSSTKVKAEYAFTLISSFSFWKKTLANGKQVIDRVSIELPDKIFENIQNRYTRPIDKGFRDGLEKWISKRLYELLGVKFYALQRKKKEPYRTRYSRLCALVGITRQGYLSTARRVLSRAHGELERKGFLAKVEWYAVRNDTKDWVLCYWPGARAQAEWNKTYWKEAKVPQSLVLERLPEVDAEPVWVDEIAPDETAFEAKVSSMMEPSEEPLAVDELEVMELEEEGEEVWTLKVQERKRAPTLPRKAPVVGTPVSCGSNGSGRPSGASGVAQSANWVAGSAESEGDGYEQTAMEAFEEGTGEFRKLAHLTKKERQCLSKWRECGVCREDIIEGTKDGVRKHVLKASRSGMAVDAVVSLAYVSGNVLDAAKRRQGLELLERESRNVAQERQSKELKEREESLKQELKGIGGVQMYEDFMRPLLLVDSNVGSVVFASPMQDCGTFFQRQGWMKELGRRVGCAVYVVWVVEWVQGPNWKKMIG